jgi:hypothetical protein
LNRSGYSTGKGKRWNQIRVATARRNHSIAGQQRALPDPERVSLSEAARICGISHHTIQKIVEAGLLKREQVTPRAPGKFVAVIWPPNPFAALLSASTALAS